LRLALFLQKRNFIELEKGKTTKIKEIIEEVVTRIFKQWQLANVLFKHPVTQTPWTVHQKIQNMWNKISDIVWHRTRVSLKQRDELETKLDKLLDIVICKCPISICSKPCSKDCLGGHTVCICPRYNKVPEVDLAWVHAQRQKVQEKSSMAIVGIDKVETNKKVKTEERKLKDAERLERKRRFVPDLDNNRIDVKELDEDEEIDEKRRKSTSKGLTARMRLARQTLAPPDDTDPCDQEGLTEEQGLLATEAGDVPHGEAGQLHLGEAGQLPPGEDVGLLHVEAGGLLHGEVGEELLVEAQDGRASVSCNKKMKYNKMPIPNTSAASVRFGTSQSETAAITSGFLLDLIEAGHLQPEMAYLAVNKEKVSRGKTAVMKMAGERGDTAATEDQITAIFFDGRKDKTQVE
jgi:hypothetical protein